MRVVQWHLTVLCLSRQTQVLDRVSLASNQLCVGSYLLVRTLQDRGVVQQTVNFTLEQVVVCAKVT